MEEEGATFSINEPLDGKASRTDVRVLKVRQHATATGGTWGERLGVVDVVEPSSLGPLSISQGHKSGVVGSLPKMTVGS